VKKPFLVVLLATSYELEFQQRIAVNDNFRRAICGMSVWTKKGDFSVRES